MKRKFTILAGTAAVGALGGFSTGCKKLEARENLNKGVAAFKSAKYPEAVQYFQQAIDLDPNYPTARLYLASAYMSQYIPGAESPENMQNAKLAIETFMKVLEQNPADVGGQHFSRIVRRPAAVLVVIRQHADRDAPAGKL